MIVEDELFQSESEGDDVESDDVESNTEMLNQFKECCTNFNHNFFALSEPDITSVKLLDIMKRPLNSFEELLDGI